MTMRHTNLTLSKFNNQINRTNNASHGLKLHNDHSNNKKFSTDGKNALFVISGTKNALGEVVCVNNEVTDILAYERSELIGYNISKIMVPIIGTRHNQMMLNYFCSGGFSKNIDRMVLPLHKHGYVVPCTISHRPMPNLTTGLQFIGFLHKIINFTEQFPFLDNNVTPEEVVIILADQYWMMQAFNIYATKLFGIDPTKANIRKYVNSDDKISVCKIIPRLEDFSFVERCKSVNKVNIDLNARLIRRIIDSEIETIITDPQAQRSDDFESSFNHLESGENTGRTFNAATQAAISVADFEYGKYEDHKEAELKMKLIMISIEQTSEKIGIKVPDKTTLSNKSKLKSRIDNIVIDERASQSQSSDSSKINATNERKNIRSFKEKIREQESPFFVRCFLRLGILLFMMILATAIYEFALNMKHKNLIYRTIDDAEVMWFRYQTLIDLTSMFRTVYDIYQGYESPNSDIYKNRAEAYLDMISESIEELRELSNEVQKMEYELLPENKKIQSENLVMLEERADASAVSEKSFYTNYTLPFAISRYVVKGTLIKKYNESFINAGTSKGIDSEFQRFMEFMINNGRGTLLYYTGKSHDYIFQEISNTIGKDDYAIQIILIVDPIIIMVLMLLFIPFMLKVQSCLLKVYMHVCIVKSKDLKNWIEQCEDSAKEIKASSLVLKRIFMTETFDSKVLNQREDTQQKIIKEILVKKITEIKVEENAVEEEQGKLINKDQAVSERKHKAFSKVVRDKTKAYIIYLSLFEMYIGIFLTVNLLTFLSIRKYTNEHMEILKSLIYRSEKQSLAMLFFRESLLENSAISFFDYGNVNGMLEETFNIETKICEYRSSLYQNFEVFLQTLNSMDRPTYCEFVFKEPPEAKGEFKTNVAVECMEVFNGTMTMGLKGVVMDSLGYMKKTFNKFLMQYNATNRGFSLIELRGNEITKRNDIRSKYIYESYLLLMEDGLGLVTDYWLKDQKTNACIVFGFYLGFLFLVYAFLWNKMVSDMKMDIVKALCLLNILPTAHLESHPDFIKEMNSSSLIN